jgi:hypothetical protein
MEKAIEKLAEQILSFDEASLVHLREKYRLRIEDFDGTKDWERAVIAYCIINAVSMKNALFNQNIRKQRSEAPHPEGGAAGKGRDDDRVGFDSGAGIRYRPPRLQGVASSRPAREKGEPSTRPRREKPSLKRVK